MQSQFIDMLRYGTDLGLREIPLSEVLHTNLGRPGRTNYPVPPELAAPAAAQCVKLTMRRFAEPVANRPHTLNPMFAVPKVKEDLTLDARIVIDCTASKLNDCLPHIPMRLPTPSDVWNASYGPETWVIKLDLSDGFYHIPLLKEIADLLGICLLDEGGAESYARMRVMPMGGKTSPAIFQGLMLELRRMLYSMGFQCNSLVYIDDWLIVGPSRQAVIEAAEQVKAFFRYLGFQLHPTKETPPSQQVVFTGIYFDFTQGVMTIPDDKRLKTLRSITDILDLAQPGWNCSPDPIGNGILDQQLAAEPPHPRKVRLQLLASLAGKLAHIDYIVRGGKEALAALYAFFRHTQLTLSSRAATRPASDPTASQSDAPAFFRSFPTFLARTVPDDVIVALKFWHSRLSTNDASKLFTYPRPIVNGWQPWDAWAYPYPTLPYPRSTCCTWKRTHQALD
jgi:hypothetical protein